MLPGSAWRRVQNLGIPRSCGKCRNRTNVVFGNIGGGLRFGLVSGSTSFLNPKGLAMAQRFKLGDHVSWSSEAGRVSGRIVRVHTKDVNYKGYIHHASKDEPQYEIKSDKTAHVALHKGGVLRRLR
jgi:hypothetical protein